MYIIVMMTVSVIGAFVFAVFSYLGFFLPVDLKPIDAPNLSLIYLEYMGPYHKSVESLLTVEKWAKDNGVSCEKTFGQYLDDPEMVDSDRLRSRVGCITNEGGETEAILPEKFLRLQIPNRKVLQAIFEGSPALGPTKVYPEAHDWIKDNGFKLVAPVVEIHHVKPDKSMTTEYHFPIEKK